MPHVNWLSTTKLAWEARAVTLYLEKYLTSKFPTKLNNQAFQTFPVPSNYPGVTGTAKML